MWWKWLLGVAAVPLGAIAIVYGIGALLPRTHVARVERVMPAPVESVAIMVREVENQPHWRSGVTAIELVERRDGGVRYVERQGRDEILFEMIEEAPGRRFRSTIANPSLPFGGSWTIALSSEGSGTRIAIEERGDVRDPLYRFFGTLIFGHEGTIRDYLTDMERALRR
jgi:hypothetical protein